MSSPAPQWRCVASLSDVPAGEAKAIRIGEGRSIALFNIDGRVYATENQCPHMGYPLTRGVVRHGILTCDWHGRSFDLEGGGCFNSECDDLQTFPVDIRGREIWIQVGDSQYRRRDEHLRLLWEGLLSEDRWTISKAIALLLKGGVAEDDIVQLILRHIGRHIVSSHEADGGKDVARLINGLNVGRRYQDADRLIALTTAACSAAGQAAERLEVVPLPEPVDRDKIDRWVRMFSHDAQSGRIERCLFTAHHQGDGEMILPLLFACAVEPYFLGFADNLISLGYLSEVLDLFGWKESSELIFNLGAKLVGRRRGEPERFRRDAVSMMTSMVPSIEEAASHASANQRIEYDEEAFVSAVGSVNIQKSFDAIGTVLAADIRLDRLVTTLVLLAADRMARTPVNVDAGWGALTTELHLAASLRTAQRCGGATVAAKGLFHAAWQIFADRWLNIPVRPLTEPLSGEKLNVPDEATGVRVILDSIKSLNVQDVGRQVLGYLNAGYSGQTLLHAMGRIILWDDTSRQLLPTLRIVFDEWEQCHGSDPALGAGHPARFQLLVGLARYATDIRTNKDSQSAATTAMRFAEGKTTVEVFEE
ncbi:MAG: Rieske (2Fe-2S) protein [Candidatus Latescibacteria bacterium]|nr:Rieske (2Fe-2S) protein [Candidatus Latescibacterota bacterium]